MHLIWLAWFSSLHLDALAMCFDYSSHHDLKYYLGLQYDLDTNLGINAHLKSLKDFGNRRLCSDN